MEQQNRLTSPELEEQVKTLNQQLMSLIELVAGLMVDVKALRKAQGWEE